MKNVTDKFSRKSKYTFYVQYLFFPRNGAVYKIMWKKYGRGRQSTDDSIRCTDDSIRCT